MKKVLAVVLSAVMSISLIACSSSAPATETAKPEANTEAPATEPAKTEGAAETEEAAAEAPASEWLPSDTITFAVASGAGGGSDLFTREIASLMTEKDLVNKQTVLVSNETDGGGEVVRNRVAKAEGDDHLILAFMAGAVYGMLKNTDLRMEDFRPIAVLAADKHMFLKGQQSKYEDINAFIEAAKAGEHIVIGGSKNDDVAVTNAFLEEIGVLDQGNIEYIIYDSTSDAIVALLGGHIELCVAKPAAAMEYVKSGRATTVLSFSKERFAAPFDNAPTMVELGYSDVEIPLWRGVVAPGAMSDEVAAYYADVFAQIAESDEWKAYCEENLLDPMNITGEDAVTYMMDAQAAVAESLGK
ncbi:MAG: tripartite tricarboxylate transporter substrate binding protein [Clostridium sp.]|nr:tripartite tricarboxylate transporter substrate binding protein [Clostridium sp.]